MKINSKILSIPPYISTSWKNVVSLHKNEDILIIGLFNGSKIEIPHLDPTVLKAVFAAHEKYLEQDSNANHKNINSLPPNFPPNFSGDTSAIFTFPFRIGMDSNIGNLLQHNPEAAHSPDLPKEILEKIAAFSKMAEFENTNNFPKPEPHCNCTHCQIMRMIHDDKDQSPQNEELEEISIEDLRFREWDIQQAGEKLYLVSNPFNAEEHYNVFLGHPIGCTCGKHNCEHIRAVLNT